MASLQHSFGCMLLLGLVAVLLAGPALSQEPGPCHDHGQQLEDRCICSSAVPNGDETGYVGDQCGTPVHRLYLNGQDVQETCGEGRVCNVVAPGEPVCFATSVADMLDASYHMDILLVSNSVDAAVELWGLLTNFTATTDAETSTTTFKSEVYPNSTSTYSFSLHTTHDAPAAHLPLSRRQLGWGAYDGMFLCVESKQSTTFMLRSATHSCPVAVAKDGSLRTCSGRGTAADCERGHCACPAPYLPPPNWVITPDLGFDDCSAMLQPLAAGAGAVAVAAQPPGAWAFFEIQVPEQAFELVVKAEADEVTKASLELYLRHQLLPTSREGEYDLMASQRDWWAAQQAAATLRRTDPVFQTGTWYAGVYNRGSQALDYSITLAANACPSGCSGRGDCNAATNACLCNEFTSQAPDCANSAFSLELGKPASLPPRSATFQDHIMLPSVTPKLASPATSRLVLTASFTLGSGTEGGSSGTLPDWVSGRPLLLVSNGVTGSAIWPEGAVARIMLENASATYQLEVGPWMLVDDALHLTMYNPVPPPYQIGYTLSAAVVGTCLNACSGHGTCDPATGLCTCEAGWGGGDCSADTSQSAKVCGAGARQARHLDDKQATCWAPCKDDGSGYDPEACADFTCDAATPEGRPLRRRGQAQECVVDSCLAGSYTVTDASGRFACTKACVCPEDGGACAMADACQPGSVQCLDGLRKTSSPEEACVEPPPCEEGSLKKAYDLAAAAGSAFAVCTCNGGACAYSNPTLATGTAGAVVVCKAGLQLQGSTDTKLSDGSVVATGGSCIKAPRAGRRGVSGGMVFFYCLLSIALAAGLVVGGKYGLMYYEQYRYGNSIFSQGYMSWGKTGATSGGAADDW